jgi:beta-lactam-binding protein with PASTA domain
MSSLFMNIKHILWTLPFLSFITGYLCISMLIPTQEITTPSLIGTQLHDATTLLADKKLNVRILRQQEDASLAHGTIVYQIPAAGQKIKTNQSVFLAISCKPMIPSTPRIMGSTRNDIDMLARSQQLRIQYIFVSSTLPKEYCVAQEPSPNTSLTQDPIIAYLSDGQETPVLFPQFNALPVHEVQNYLNHIGITPTITYVNPSQQENAMVIDQRPLAGSIITLNSRNPAYVQLLVK